MLPGGRMTTVWKAANLWVARIFPFLVTGAISYVSWVVVALCVDYLLKPAGLRPARSGAAIAILVIYFLLLFFVACTYYRILYTLVINPGYVERGPQYYAVLEEKKHQVKGKRDRFRKSGKVHGAGDAEKGFATSYKGAAVGGRPNPSESVGLQDFYRKEVFVCEGDGRPVWCSMCMNWKPDRTHHCSEVNRCVRKMDHYCPWVGGIVSERNFKFFIQFVCWTFIYCTFILIIMAIFISEVTRDSQQVDVHWIASLVLAALFGIFTLGLAGSSIQFALLNSTSVENLSRAIKIWSLAVHILNPTNPSVPTQYRTITYPLTPSSQTTDPETQVGPARVFAILHSKVGESPYDLGPWGNFKSVMGDNFIDWILPIRYSPCCNHDSSESDFALGPVFQRMKEEAGLATLPNHVYDENVDKRRRRRPRHSSTGQS